MADALKITDARRQTVDGRALTEALGIDAEEVAWRKAFTGFDATDEERLVEMAPLFESLADDLVESFYENIQAHEATREILAQSSKPVDSLKRTMHEYVLDLGRGSYDQQYFERRARIGKIHDMLDLGPKIYLGGYRIHFQTIIEAVIDEARAELTGEIDGTTVDHGGATDTDAVLDRAAGRLTSVTKLLLLDQMVAMETYIDSYSELESILEQQRTIANEVTGAVDAATEQSQAVASRSERIRKTTEEQVDEMREVADEVTTLSATTQEVASTADAVRETSERADALAEAGHESAREAVTAITDAGDASTTVDEDVERLNETVDDIDRVVEVIEEIADQTNLLALNASIEAARAGEAGDGFAVVADEVKSLAEASKARAGEIESLVRDIQANTSRTSDSLDEARRRLTTGIEAVEATMDSLDEIATAVDDTSSGISEVAEATDDQARSAEAIAGMVDRLYEQTDGIYDDITEATSANERLVERMADIDETVRRFDTDRSRQDQP